MKEDDGGGPPRREFYLERRITKCLIFGVQGNYRYANVILFFDTFLTTLASRQTLFKAGASEDTLIDYCQSSVYLRHTIKGHGRHGAVLHPFVPLGSVYLPVSY